MLETCQDPQCRNASIHLAHKWVDGKPLFPNTECYRILNDHFRREAGLMGIHLRPAYSLQPTLTLLWGQPAATAPPPRWIEGPPLAGPPMGFPSVMGSPAGNPVNSPLITVPAAPFGGSIAPAAAPPSLHQPPYAPAPAASADLSVAAPPPPLTPKASADLSVGASLQPLPPTPPGAAGLFPTPVPRITYSPRKRLTEAQVNQVRMGEAAIGGPAPSTIIIPLAAQSRLPTGPTPPECRPPPACAMDSGPVYPL